MVDKKNKKPLPLRLRRTIFTSSAFVLLHSTVNRPPVVEAASFFRSSNSNGNKFEPTTTCTVNQVVELVFNTTSQEYEYWTTSTEYDSVRRPLDPSDYFQPKISAGMFRLCTCDQLEVVCPLETKTCFLAAEEHDNDDVFLPTNTYAGDRIPATRRLQRKQTERRRSLQHEQQRKQQQLSPYAPITSTTTTDAGVKCILAGTTNYTASNNHQSSNNSSKMSSNSINTLVQGYIWPFLLLWYGIFLIYLVGSAKGKQAILYCILTVTCSKRFWYNRMATRIIEQQQRQQRQQQEAIHRDDDQETNQINDTSLSLTTRQETEQPIQQPDDTDANIGRKFLEIVERFIYRHAFSTLEERLVEQQAERQLGTGTSNHMRRQVKDASHNNARRRFLKTKKYSRRTMAEISRHGQDDDDDDDGDDCPICYQKLNEGERVGDLACGHVFHISCLKTWVGNKDECPLCRQPIAIE
mmetsp:Transcript_6742/g.11705  ORF Transcript_6742/g.11705 Transcript_6742/m.11705 type:complete len:467 (+) Transcript_6742:47-1447(+)